MPPPAPPPVLLLFHSHPPTLPALKTKGGYLQGPTWHLPACRFTSQFTATATHEPHPCVSPQPGRAQTIVLGTSPVPGGQRQHFPKTSSRNAAPKQYHPDICVYQPYFYTYLKPGLNISFKTSSDLKVTKVQVTASCFLLCKEQSKAELFK